MKNEEDFIHLLAQALQKLDRLSEGIGKVEQELGGVKTQITHLDNKVDNFYHEFSELRTNVHHIDKVVSFLPELYSRVEALEDKVYNKR